MAADPELGHVPGDDPAEFAPHPGTFHNFEAVHDRGADGLLRLHVSGEIEYPDDCHLATLERMRSGINPRILMLRLAETRVGGCHDVITRELVEWSEPSDTEFDEVQVLPGGPTIYVQCAH